MTTDSPTDGSNDAPPVSVVIPTCNRRAILQRCLEALAAQTYENYEIIVVDDCSTDDTPEFLARFAEQHPDLNLRCLRNENHAGANPSRNRGIEIATGDLVAFLDSDCIADPDWIANLVAGFQTDRVAAVTGLVRDAPPTNIFELTFKGTHRLAKAGPANRLVAGNMCIRQDILRQHVLDVDRASQPVGADGRPDVSVSGRGDEEGLYLYLKASGFEIIAAPNAVVLHEHHYTGRTLFRQAFRGGQSAARLVYKYHLPPRIDMIPFVLTYTTLPLMLVRIWLGAIPAFFFSGAIAAITYNDLFRKGKTVVETAITFPILLLYYHFRLVGYVSETLALRLGFRSIKRKRLHPSR